MARKPKPQSSSGKPKFPYTTSPTLLRKFLAEVPKRPKPPQVTFSLLQTWGIKGSNARSIISVIKDLGLIDASGTPSVHYTEFMRNERGPTVLAARIREVYSELFVSSLEPHKDTHDSLKNFFNIHSGGSERVIQLQVQTFNALCEHADFTGTTPITTAGTADARKASGSIQTGQGQAQIHIELHIHLPENKSRSDYEDIIKDIGKYIYGK